MKKIKIKFFAIACIVLMSLATLTTSCSKDDDKEQVQVQVQQPNTVTIDGKTESITDAYSVIYDGLIYVDVSTKKNGSKLGDIFGTYEFEIPLNRVGEKIRLEENMDSNPYYRVAFYEFFLDDLGLYSERIARYRNSDTGFLIGTNNWIQFTKDSKQEKSYSVDFEMNLEGKIIKGNYTGVFE